MSKRTFSKEFMREVLSCDEGEIVENSIIDTGRWSVHYNLIFKHEGAFYQTSYSRGATESQDERPFDYEDEVACVEVFPVQKTVTVYEEVK